MSAWLLQRVRPVGGRLRAISRPIRRRVGILSICTLIYLATFASGALVSRLTPCLSLQLRTTTAGSVQVAWVLPGGTLWDRGLRAGDRVLQLDGSGWTSQTGVSCIGRQLVARRTNGRLVTATPQDVETANDFWPLVVLSPWFFLFGCSFLLRAKGAGVGVTAFALFGLAAEAFALGPVADCNRFVLGQMAERVVIPCFAASFAAFFLVFPTVRTLRPHIWIAALLPALLAAVLDVWGTAEPAIYPFSSIVWLAVLLFYLALGVGLAVQAFVCPPNAAARLGLLVIAVSTALAVLPLVALSLVPLLLGLPQLLHAEHAVLAAALMPVGFTYAIVFHEAIDVHLIQRWLPHGLLWVAMSACYGLVAFAAFLWTGLLPVSSPDLALLTVFLALAVGGSFPRLYLPLQRVVDRRVFKDDYDLEKELVKFNQRMSTDGILESLVGSAPAKLKDLMNLEFVLLLERRHHHWKELGSDGIVPDDLQSNADSTLPVVHHAQRLLACVAGGRTVLLAPLAAQECTVGCLCLGSKQSGEPLRPKDESFLLAVAGHLATAICNVRLTEERQAQLIVVEALHFRLQSVQEEERAHLAAEIHDESLQTALHLQRQLAGGGDARTIERLYHLCRTLVDQLRAICMQVRPPALDDFGLAAALEALADELSRHTGRAIAVDADPAVADLPLSAAVQLMLYRAAQEALNNALKHAQAAILLVTLRGTDDNTVELCVIDDGCGFSVPPSLDGLVAAGHLGLAGLLQRVQRCGGSVDVISQPAQGTTVKVRLPMPGDA